MKHAGTLRGLFVAVLFGFGLLAAGCAAADSAPVHDATAFRPAPEVPPIERLGRWDGTTFVPVRPASVANGDLYVLVHGWAPGYLAAVRSHHGPGPLLAWAPQAVNAQGQGMVTDFVPMAAAITRDDPRATVLAFSWIDDSATARSPLDAWISESRTDLNGQRLAAALGQVLAPTFDASGGRIHLIGHSHGAKVVTVAAIALDHPPVQVTLLDSPEDVLAQLPGAANHLEGYLPLLPIGRGPGQTFVDSYFSIFGERYGRFPGLRSVVDVKLDPAQYAGLSVDNVIARHGYPVAWYTKSAEDLGAGVGMAWSPLIGRPPDCPTCSFAQDWTGPGAEVQTADELRLRLLPTESPDRGRPRPPDISGGPRRLEARPLRGPLSSLRPDGVVLTAPGSRLWQVEFDRTPDDLAIEFDDRFTAAGAGSELGVWLDDRQVLTTASAWSGATGHHAVVDVSSLDPGPHTITAVLSTPARGSQSRVILGDFEVQSRPGVAVASDSLSTAATLALLALGLFAVVGVLAWVLRRREPEASAGG